MSEAKDRVSAGDCQAEFRESPGIWECGRFRAVPRAAMGGIQKGESRAYPIRPPVVRRKSTGRRYSTGSSRRNGKLS